MSDKTFKPISAFDLACATETAALLVGTNSNGDTLKDARRVFLRLVGEVWRLRAKCRYQRQRIEDLEQRIGAPRLESAPVEGAKQLPEVASG